MNNLTDVVRHVNAYFEEYQKEYTVFEIRRQSYLPEKNHLYMVVAKKADDTFTVWTWNDNSRSLSNGNYNLSSMAECAKIISEYQNISTTCNENNSPLEYLFKLLVIRDDLIEDTYQELLYIRGYADGITAQQIHKWDKMTQGEVDNLFKETIEV